jgi:type IV secretion system protein VirB2
VLSSADPKTRAHALSWGWCIGAILGIAIAFGAPQIVSWVRGMFGV